ncbi:MAG: TonB-dependent receptor, partial [Gammaproteobacteria bacterium]|nr:TonB-dependent receptor [Gammaproteobacteria bacterium]
QAAVRYEDFSTGQSSTDPKFGITYAPFDWLTLRATRGDAFIAPSLEQLFNPETCGLTTVTDRMGPFSAFTTGCAGGNPLLENEESDSEQFGFDLEFGDFDFHVTYNNTDFENRIIGTSGQAIMELDFLKFQQATGFTGDGLTAANQPSQAQVEAWVASGQQDPRITRSPDDVYDIIQIKSGSSNAETVEVTAYDISGNYLFNMGDVGLDGWGDVRIGLQATFIEEFDYQEDPLSPIVDGAGKYNDSTGAAPNLPEWKINLRIGWTMGNHSVNTITRYIDSMPYDGPSFSHIQYFDFVTWPARVVGGDVNEWTQMDASYTYRGIEMFGGEAAFTLGSRNLFDRKAQRSPEFAGVIGQLQDPMGRSIYARFVYDF